MNSELEVRGEVSLMEGGGALPRKSGDLVFHDNWERRAFAIAIALYEKGYYDWDDFRRILIDQIDASGETALNPMPDNPGYYEHWLSSLEKLLTERHILDSG